MTGNELLDKMSLIDPDFVETAEAPPKRRRPLKWVLLAACICLLAGTVAATSQEPLPIKLPSLFIFPTEHSPSLPVYDSQIPVEKLPMSAFHGPIEEVPEQILRRYANYGPFYSSPPGLWISTFDTLTQAGEFLGLSRLTLLSPGQAMGLDQKGTSLAIHGNPRGELEYLELTTYCYTGRLNLTFFSHIYTEYYSGQVTDPLGIKDIQLGDVSMYTSFGGTVCHIIPSAPQPAARAGIEGYLIHEGILYSLHISCPETDAAQAEALIHQWADLF